MLPNTREVSYHGACSLGKISHPGEKYPLKLVLTYEVLCFRFRKGLRLLG